MRLQPYYDIYACTENPVSPPELTLIHGWGMHGSVWDAVMPGLLKRFQVTVVDLPGMGRSPLPNRQYDLDLLVEQVLQVAPKNSLWLGWSLGGMVAMRAATVAADRISHLITTATSPKFVSDEHWAEALAPSVLQQFMARFEEDAEGTLIRFLTLQAKGGERFKQDVTELRESLYLHGLPAQRALRSGLDILLTTDLRAELQQLSQPSLHLFGANDLLVPATVTAAITALQPQATTQVLAGTSHLPFITAPDRFIAAIEHWLAEFGL